MAVVIDISVKERGKLIVSQKSKRTYFTVTAEDNTKYICFNPHLHEVFEVGQVIKTNIDMDKETPNILSLALEGEPPVKPAASTVKSTVPEKGTSVPQTGTRHDSRDKSMAVAYIKDIYVALINAGVIKDWSEERTRRMCEFADIIVSWIER